MQTKEEEEEEASDVRWAKEHRALVQRFIVKGKTVTAITNLTRVPIANLEAERLCHELAGFVWANDNRTYGLENIEIVGRDGVILAAGKDCVGMFTDTWIGLNRLGELLCIVLGVPEDNLV